MMKLNGVKFLDKSALTKIQTILIVAVVVVAGTIGAAFWLFMQSEDEVSSIVWGDVFLDEPIVGATIGIYDLDGNKIFEENEATGETGLFIFEVDWGIKQQGGELPSEFKVVASGGTRNGEYFNGTVVSIAHNYTRGGYCVVNEITTLLAAYGDKHLEISPAEVEETIKEFVGVPSNVDVLDVIEFNNTSFHSATFMSEAEEAGGFDAFIDVLVDEVENGETHID